MIRRRGSPSQLVPGLALACLGCLPDPPAYDACTGDESNYYVVPPKGCNGAVLATLQESQVQDPQSSLAMAVHQGGFYIRSTIELDEQYVYWVAPDNVVMRTAKTGETTEALFVSAMTSAGILGIDHDRRRLYVGECSVGSLTRQRSRVLELDLDAPTISSEALVANVDPLPTYATVLADLADFAFTRGRVSEDRLFLLQRPTGLGLSNDFTGAGRLLTAAIEPEKVAQVSDLQILVDDVVQKFTLSDSHLVYLPVAGGLMSYDLESGMAAPLLNRSAPYPVGVHASKGQLLYLRCAGIECTWTRLEADGGATPLAQGLNSFGDADIPVVADARGTYVLAHDQHGLSRLLDYSKSSLAPRLMVASLRPVYTLLAMDERYVFIRTEDVNYSQEAPFATRLLRVTR